METEASFQQYYLSRRQVSAFILGRSPDPILPDVVLAPCWTPESIGIIEKKSINSRTCAIWNCTLRGKRFTYIQAGVGAGTCADIVMSLKETACKKLLFLGSVGAIDLGICVGDLMVPKEAVCGDGLCRYLSDSLAGDCLLESYRPDMAFYELVLAAAEKQAAKLNIHCFEGRSFSVESIFSQFRHLQFIIENRCNCIDMETAAFFKSATICGFKAAALHCVSDNALVGESLITVSEEKTNFRKEIRSRAMPEILAAFLGE